MKYAVEINFRGAAYRHSIEANDHDHARRKISAMYHKAEILSIRALDGDYEVCYEDIPEFLRIKK